MRRLFNAAISSDPALGHLRGPSDLTAVDYFLHDELFKLNFDSKVHDLLVLVPMLPVPPMRFCVIHVAVALVAYRVMVVPWPMWASFQVKARYHRLVTITANCLS